MQIRLANPRGFCAGVDRAIEIVNRALDVFGAPIYVRHEVVHNKFVVDNLRNRGAVFVEEIDATHGMVTSEPMVVLKPTDGCLVDVSPDMNNDKYKLFVPDPMLQGEWVLDLIRACEMKAQMRGGDRAWCDAPPRTAPRVRCDCYDGESGPLCEPIAGEHADVTFCLNQCSGRGACRSGFCECRAGAYGADCSLPTTPTTATAAASTATSPPRPRIYVYELPGDPLALAGAWRTPERFDDIDPSQLSLRAGCSIHLVAESSAYLGATRGEGCVSTLGGASYATSEVSIEQDVLSSWDRGYYADGTQAWGATLGPYVFVRQ